MGVFHLRYNDRSLAAGDKLLGGRPVEKFKIVVHFVILFIYHICVALILCCTLCNYFSLLHKKGKTEL